MIIGIRVNFAGISQPEQPPVIESSKGEIFRVPSGSDPSKTYTVSVTFDGKIICTCPGYTYRDKCKHQKIVIERIAERATPSSTTPEG